MDHSQKLTAALQVRRQAEVSLIITRWTNAVAAGLFVKHPILAPCVLSDVDAPVDKLSLWYFSLLLAQTFNTVNSLHQQSVSCHHRCRVTPFIQQLFVSMVVIVELTLPQKKRSSLLSKYVTFETKAISHGVFS